jgi:hypothetical protein
MPSLFFYFPTFPPFSLVQWLASQRNTNSKISTKNPATTMDAQTYSQQQGQTARFAPGGMIPGLPMPNISGQPNGLVGKFAWNFDYLVPLMFDDDGDDVPDWEKERRPLANIAIQVISSRDPSAPMASSRTRR